MGDAVAHGALAGAGVADEPGGVAVLLQHAGAGHGGVLLRQEQPGGLAAGQALVGNHGVELAPLGLGGVAVVERGELVEHHELHEVDVLGEQRLQLLGLAEDAVVAVARHLVDDGVEALAQLDGKRRILVDDVAQLVVGGADARGRAADDAVAQVDGLEHAADEGGGQVAQLERGGRLEGGHALRLGGVKPLGVVLRAVGGDELHGLQVGELRLAEGQLLRTLGDGVGEVICVAERGRALLDLLGEFLVALGVMLDDALVAGKEDDLVVVVVFWIREAAHREVRVVAGQVAQDGGLLDDIQRHDVDEDAVRLQLGCGRLEEGVLDAVREDLALLLLVGRPGRLVVVGRVEPEEAHGLGGHGDLFPAAVQELVGQVAVLQGPAAGVAVLDCVLDGEDLDRLWRGAGLCCGNDGFRMAGARVQEADGHVLLVVQVAHDLREADGRRRVMAALDLAGKSHGYSFLG